MPVDEYKAMRGLDGTITEDVDALYRHFTDEVMPRNRWSFVELALFLEDRLKVRRHMLSRKERTVFGLLLERVKANYQDIPRLLKEGNNK
ncbi:MAG: hypothetical protein KUF77_18625 [Candidatus Thiodiazotropha sp. (ex Lucina aurantia)]|nr:hypothetical protein [Candidatus Thiodiazotropha sp. (ex Lucina pensylvanica)]MBT3025240.1 hypothetical protein [Candidatus Thiodiazotropha taylori]MBV2098383.1 hypothetical protein [Candidatus Thiodiazotropha sp. (ex Codakia orbicularis)]MBV2105049.1 hypothetical protein [Candidatus Thiodiazotropha sp. (ex Lucina aurantia)]MBV2118895.1 hypothetical protein [Candidatus Thiodiazotropha sp. (ex Lucina aurantia)]